MSDPYAPPGSQRAPDRGQDARRAAAPPPLPPAPPKERTPPDPAGAVRTARLSLRFLLLVLAALVAMALPWPWNLAGLAFLVAAGVVGIIALVVAAQAHLRASQLAALSVGLVMTAVLVVVQLLMLFFWQQTAARDECRRTAVTATSLAACDTDFEQQMRSFVPSAP